MQVVGCRLGLHVIVINIIQVTQSFTKMLTLGLNIIFWGLMLALVKVWVVQSAMVKQ